MIIWVESRKVWFSLVFVLVTFLLGISLNPVLQTVSGGGLDFRVFVAGIGTVEGKWARTTGLAVIGLETKSSPEVGQELKIIDLLVANNGPAPLVFDADITLVTKKGDRFGLTAEGQPQVIVNPGEISQGTVIISVPEGIPNDQWILEIKGGSIKEGVQLPIMTHTLRSGNRESVETIKMQEGIIWHQ